MSTEYYYLLMSQQDLLQNEVIEEVIRERASSYILQNKKIDFWILINPKFVNDINLPIKIKQTNFYKQKKNMVTYFNDKCEFYTAIVSTNKEFITWLSLRLGYFEDIDSFEKLNPVNPNYISNGITGKVDTNSLSGKNFSFDAEPKNLHPTFLTTKYQKLLEILYTYKK